MQEAPNIIIQLVPLHTPCGPASPQIFYYDSVAEAVKGYESIRRHSTTVEHGHYSMQLRINDRIMTEHFLNDSAYIKSLETFRRPKSDAA